MAGLVGYDSSDEEDDVPEQPPKASQANDQPKNGPDKPPQTSSSAPIQPQTSTSTPQLGPIQGPVLGPSLGPSLPPSLPEATPSPSALPQDPDQPPRSPYSQTRSLIQDLTLPPVPFTSIPPSPPGSPPRDLTAKFTTFLDLKANKGIHFNARLSSSTAARNPGLMDKLLGFVGVETSFEEGEDEKRGIKQYETTLPKEIWDPNLLPGWARKGELRRAVERANKERERKVGGKVEFVSAGTAVVSEVGDRVGTPGGEAPGLGAKRRRVE